MPFSIELFFDTKSDLAVQKMGYLLEKRGIPTIFSALGATPHLSLAVFERVESPKLHSLLKKAASNYPPLPFRLSGLGTFPGKEGVLYLVPAANPRLLEIHAWFHRTFRGLWEGNWSHYLPGNWVPHCTLSTRLTLESLLMGITYLARRGVSVQGRCSRLALVEIHPESPRPVRLVYSMPFSGKTRKA
jgi:2'-5' RNA ligase